MYVRANSSIPMFSLTVACRTNPVRVPDVIVRMSQLAWPSGLQGQVNPLASSETTVLKTRFGPGDAGDPLSRSIAFERTSTERSCHLDKGPTDTRIQVWLARRGVARRSDPGALLAYISFIAARRRPVALPIVSGLRASRKLTVRRSDLYRQTRLCLRISRQLPK